MVDTSVKEISRRVARATATLQLSQKVFQLLLKQGSPKGNVFETAKLAGIMAAKSTPQMIPLCHPLEINKVTVNFVVNKKKSQIIAQSEVACLGRTGGPGRGFDRRLDHLRHDEMGRAGYDHDGCHAAP